MCCIGLLFPSTCSALCLISQGVSGSGLYTFPALPRERKKKTTILRVLRTTDDIKSKPRKRRRLHEIQPAQVRGCGRELSAGLRTPYREKQIKKQQEGNQSPKETTRPARGRHQLILISTIHSIEQGSKGWGTFAWCYWVSITLSFTPGAQSQSPRP